MYGTSLNTGQQNDRIVVVRLLCIFGMIYVHVPSLDSAYVVSTANDSGLAWFDLTRAFLVDGYGRASACLLSVISGYLIVNTSSVEKQQLTHFYRRKFKSIYMPMVAWGMLTLLVFSFASMYQHNVLSDVCGTERTQWLDCINVVFHLNAISTGPTMHLAFLRDLFVCILLAPVLLILLKHAPVAVLSSLAVAYLLDIESLLILRPLILLSFTVGLTIGLYHHKVPALDKLCPMWLCLAIFVTGSMIAFNNGYLPSLRWFFDEHGFDARENLFFPLTRLFGALALWTLAAKLTASRFTSMANKIEPGLFIAFCCHPLLFSLIQGLAQWALSESLVLQWYPAWFAVAPAIAIALALLGMRVCAAISPALSGLISGGRHWADTTTRTQQMRPGAVSFD